MENKIKAITQPFINKVALMQDHKQKNNDLKNKLEELKAIDPLEITLEQYTELNQLNDFLAYVENKSVNIGSIQIDKGSTFENIGQIIGAELEKDPALTSSAIPFNKASLTDNATVMKEAEESYLNAYNQAFEIVYSNAEPLINEYLTALKEVRNRNFRHQIDKFLPQPLTADYIKQWHEYENEAHKFNPRHDKRSFTITKKPLGS